MAAEGDSASIDAKTRFARWLERRERGEDAQWEDELTAAPAHAEELRTLHARWLRVEGVFAGLVTEPSMLASAAREALTRNEPPDDATRAALELLDAPDRGRVRYAELARIARGGMGVVTRVHDRDLDRDLALKTLRSGPRGSTATDGRALRRFLLEARTAARLEHPGILPVHDLGLDASGRPYFTMPLVRGITLAEALELARSGREGWTLARVLEVILKVCDALAYAHEQGVVHRDLKPANVLVGRFGEAYVTDWGLARWIQEREEPPLLRGEEAEPASRTGGPEAHGPETARGAVLGTVQYMAPEQARGNLDEVGPRSDVYSIGAILYHALAGSMPFASANEEAALAALKNGPPPALAVLAPTAPRELVSICEKAMARRSSARYATPAEMATDLRAYMEGRVVRAHEGGPLAELRKWIGRNRGLTLLTLALVVLAVIAVAVNGWIELQRRHQTALLADARKLDDLVARAKFLWPATPKSLPEFEVWVREAEDLAARAPAWENELRAMRAAAVAPASDRRFEFTDPDARWRHELLTRFVSELQRFTSADPAIGTLADVRAGLAFARDVQRTSIDEPRAQWERARASTASSPRYSGLQLEPQLGLVPLGVDPDSGLEEFAHLASGEVPRRGRDGRLEVGPATSIVLVLVPGGRTRLGSVLPSVPGGESLASSRETDLLARVDETPCVEVELEPYLLSKYELDAAQWTRIARKPLHAAGEDLLPAETIGWSEAIELLARVGLDLPTESQWEHAVRAGSDARFFCGREAACLTDKVQAGWFADGKPLHAEGELHPISIVRGASNTWGFVHVAGNVAEWVLDPYRPTLAGARRPGDGLAVALDVDLRVVRGGSFVSSPVDLRCAARRALVATTRSPEVGLRPARRLDRTSVHAR